MSKPKHMREEVRKFRRIYIVFLIIAFALIITLLVIMCININQPVLEAPKQPVYIGTRIVDKRYIPPDTYEVLYWKGYDNGFGVEKWEEVSREVYERSDVDVRP